jgi:hypothetical protein
MVSSLIGVAALAASFSITDAHGSDVVAEIGQPLTLMINQTARIETADLDLTFAKVTEDSRCPSDVTCIWAGQVSIVVDVTAPDGSGQLTLTLSGGQSEAKSFGDYSIRLADVQPYPVSTKKLAPSDYVATLVVYAGNQVTSHGVFVKAKATGLVAVAGWNVEKGQGAAVLFMQDIPRVIIRFTPSYSGDCFHGPEPAECIDGRVTFTSNDGAIAQGGKVHAEVDGSRTLMFLTFPGLGGEHALNLTQFKVWSKPIVTGGNVSVVFLKEGERDGPLLVQKIFPDHVEGTNFPEYPIATDNGFPITLRIGERASNGCTVMLTLVKIEDGTATFVKTVDENRPCPICWLQEALISGQAG